MTPEKPGATKVTVDTVENPVELADETIEALAEATTDGSGYRPDTLAEEGERALMTLGQRRVNLIWEYTQSYVAVLVVTATVGVAAMQAWRDPGSFPDILTLLAGVVVGNYFARTNHQAIGGVGHKPSQPYIGR